MDEQSKSSMVREAFDTVAGGYDGQALRFFPEGAKQLADLLGLSGDERVLDVATGTGNAALALARRLPRGRVTGVDFSSGMLEQARRKCSSEGLRNVEFLERDMQALGFEPGEFDAATCSFGIFFVDDMDAQLAQIARTVRRGGQVAITCFQENYFHPLKELMVGQLASHGVLPPPQAWLRIAREEGCRELFERAGLRDVRVEQRNLGYFLADEREWWDVVWNAGFRRLLSQLPPVNLERFRLDHLREVAALATPKGIWLDIGVLFTLGVRG
jgi:ubiquinone/menaquinone biosynthesis C-methylase UbiE